MGAIGHVQESTRGHRLLPHTADVIIEAWAPQRLECFEEAMAALVEVFAQPAGEAVARRLPLSVEAGSDQEVLVSLLEEEIYTTEVLAAVPVRVSLADGDDGTVTGVMEVVEPSEVELVGPIPKAISYHELEVGRRGGEWRCRVVVDV